MGIDYYFISFVQPSLFYIKRHTQFSCHSQVDIQGVNIY